MHRLFIRPGNVVRMKKLSRNNWYDTDTKLFEATFQILVDYVEQELAWEQFLDIGKARWYHRWVPLKNRRELGLRWLSWEIEQGADSPDQSKTAREVMELYLWYKDVRPNRHDPWSDVPDYEEDLIDENGRMLPADRDSEFMKAAQLADDTESAYAIEDTEQIIRIIKIRRSMWT